MTTTAPHQAIYRRWRAQTFAQIVGQEAVVETLRNAVRLDRVSHGVLFVGPRGTGKTSLARILAKAVNCTNLQDGDPCDACPSCVAIREGRAIDLVEIDAASNRGIDAIRDLRDRIHYAPSDLRRKVYILDEAHQITKDAWNALLKSLEEPPDFVVFMFASTHPQEFPPAILSRLQRYDVRRLTVPEIEGKLARILEADGRPASPEALHLIARLAAGGMRDAESILDQVLASSADGLDEHRVRELLGLAEADVIDGFLDALVRADPAAGIGLLDGLEDRGRDVRVFLDQVIEALRTRLSGSLSDREGRDDVQRLATVARRLAAIDPNRAGVGGLRLQLELALFDTGAAAVGAVPAAVAAAPAVAKPVVHPAVAASAGAGDPAEKRSTSQAPSRATAPEPPGAQPTAPSTVESRAANRASATVPDAPSTPSGPDLDRLAGGWTDVVASVSPATRAVIAECRPLSIEGNVVTLGFPEAKAFLKDVADRKRAPIEEAVGRFLGRAIAVRCVATNLDLVGPSIRDPEGATFLDEARRIFADDLVDVSEVS